MNFQCILLDLDGTLTDSGPGIKHAVRYALEHFGITKTDAALNPFIGPPLSESFAQFGGIADGDIAEAIRLYRECYTGGAMLENSVYPGIREVLETLQGMGIPLILATAKPLVYSVKILEHFDLYRYFTDACGATLDGSVKTKTEVITLALEAMKKAGLANPVMVGDREQDITGAHHCGVPAAGVMWGYGSRQELIDAGADIILERPKDIIGLAGRNHI